MSTSQERSSIDGPSLPGPAVLVGPDALRAAIGRELGPTRPVVIGADRVEAYGRAARTPIELTSARSVPSLLLLSLVNYVLPRLVDIRGFDVGLNYGTGRVRFREPVAVGTSVRGSLVIQEVADVPGGVQATYRVTLACARTGALACVADSLARYLV
jgi:hypothetical protein